MSTILSSYTLSIYDVVETGRTKINFLETGDTSPFYIWSGVPDTQRYLSVYRNSSISNVFNLPSNYINYRTDIFSGASVFNFIINGLANLIDTTNAAVQTDFSGGYNILSGILNKISAGSGNTVVGSGNTITIGDVNLINGSNNNISVFNGNLNSIVSSENSKILAQLYSKNNVLISSYNSNIFERGFSSTGNSFSFISGKNNAITSGGFFGSPYDFFGFDYIGNGFNNETGLHGTNPNINSQNKFNNSDITGIINGVNNSITGYSSNKNSILFGSNLTTVSSGYSHFENLYVDETLLGEEFAYYQPADGDEFELDVNYSFHYISAHTASSNLSFIIDLPYNPTVNLQMLTIVFNAGSIGVHPTYNVTFENSNLACKSGNSSRYSSDFPANSIVAYFFMWVNLINRWVMFTSYCDSTATF